jgi:hypothetical protein
LALALGLSRLGQPVISQPPKPGAEGSGWLKPY